MGNGDPQPGDGPGGTFAAEERAGRPERRLIPPGGAGRGLGRFAGVLLILSVLVLGGILLAVQRRVDDLREQVLSIEDPTRDRIARVQYLLARQTSSLRGYLITRDTIYLRQHASFAAEERGIYPALERHAAEVSPVASARVAELRTLSVQWHRRLQLESIAAAGANGAIVQAPTVLLEQELYSATLQAASAAMEATQEVIAERQAEIRRVERNSRFVLGLLFLLAGVIAVVISELNTRVRSLAAIGERRRREVESAMDRLERAVAERGYLVRGFTHDVKNPLNVADGYADLLELGYRGALPPEQLELVGRIRSAIRDTVSIIDDLLEISRIESGGLQVERRDVDLRALATQVVHDHTAVARQIGLDLRFVDGPDVGAAMTVRTDADRVRQVLENLVRNALKYAPPPGTVVVRLEASAGDGEHGGTWARLAVIDSGPGIPLDEQERIFYEFHRVPGSTASGHGLGLAISRRIARLLGGDVTVRSVPGQGATFELWLPTEEHPEERADPLPALSTAGAATPPAPANSTE